MTWTAGPAETRVAVDADWWRAQPLVLETGGMLRWRPGLSGMGPLKAVILEDLLGPERATVEEFKFPHTAIQSRMC